MPKGKYSSRSSISDELSNYGAQNKRTGLRLASTMGPLNASQLGVGSKFLKWFLIGWAIVVMVFGAVLVAVAAYVAQSEIVNIVGKQVVNAAIAMGVIHIVVGAVGLVGSVQESRIALTIVRSDHSTIFSLSTLRSSPFLLPFCC